jgi:hypothetical protein
VKGSAGKKQAPRHDPDYIISQLQCAKALIVNGMLQHTLDRRKNDALSRRRHDRRSQPTSHQPSFNRKPRFLREQALVSKDSKEVDFIDDVRDRAPRYSGTQTLSHENGNPVC